MHPLTHRRKNVPTLSFNLESDIQDLLHSQLRPWIADIRPEEFTPSKGGASTRMDFLLQEHPVEHHRPFSRRFVAGRDILMAAGNLQKPVSDCPPVQFRQLWQFADDFSRAHDIIIPFSGAIANRKLCPRPFANMPGGPLAFMPECPPPPPARQQVRLRRRGYGATSPAPPEPFRQKEQRKDAKAQGRKGKLLPGVFATPRLCVILKSLTRKALSLFFVKNTTLIKILSEIC